MVVSGSALAGWGAWVVYFLAVSRSFEGMRTGSWLLSGALFGLVAALTAMVLLVRGRVALPPPHAFAHPRGRATPPRQP
jgi:hypothetical protein